jgi:phosphomannomutase
VTVVKAYDIRGVVPAELTPAMVERIGAVFAALTWPEDGQAHPGVVLGRDARLSSPQLAAGFARGVVAAGVDVVDIGLASTDLLYYASGAMDLPGAMITASHNPGQYNGVKLCRAGAVPVGRDTGLATIAAALEDEQPAPPEHAAPGAVRTVDALPGYVRFLHELAPISAIRPLRVVVDAGNGMAGLTVPSVLASTPVSVDGLYLELDGTFPNHPANPLDPTTLVDLQQRVVSTGADLGLAFDGDADRCFVVDERGALVDPSAMTALIAIRELRRHPGATIIHNLITSRVVPEVVTAHGGRPHRTRTGHSFIKASMAATGAVFGGEHSGHFYFQDFWRADSGMLAALHILAALGESPPGTSLSTLLEPFSTYARSGEINSTVPDPAAVVAATRDHYGHRPGLTLDDLDGLTVEATDWWFNLRPSNTEPLLRLNVEATDQATMVAVRDEVLAFVRSWTAPAKEETVALEPWLVDILACPCERHVRLDYDPEAAGGAGELSCTACDRVFRIDDGIPVLLLDEARHRDEG